MRVPLSYAQEGLWFLDRLRGPRSTYNTPLTLDLSGPLDRDALNEAVQDVIARHESLRTVFPAVEGKPFQQILAIDRQRTEVRVIKEDASRLDQALRRESGHVFDLAGAPPITATLLALAPERHVLLILIHHIATDGWSNIPLTHDLSLAYTARIDGRAPNWEPLAVQYADYAIWQRQVLGAAGDPGSDLSRHRTYWQAELEGAPELLTLPLTWHRPASPSGAGRRLPFTWGEEVCGNIVGFGRATRCTAAMVVQAALTGLLTRLGAGEDVTLGVAVAGRGDEGMHGLVGLFTNTVVLRTDTTGNPTFRDLVLRVRERNLSAHEHQEMPFDQLVDALSPTRERSHNPLFQVLLTYQNESALPVTMPRIAASVREFDLGVSIFDLAVSVAEVHAEDGKITRFDGALHYATELFSDEAAELLNQRLGLFLRAALSDPDQPLHRLPILTETEQDRILFEWNDLRPHLESLWAR